MGRILINCDLGENETDELTAKLLSLVDAANICCGVHAGGVSKTRKTIKLASEKGVLIGAHPGLAVDGGRGDALPELDDFRDLLTYQLQRMISYADPCETWISYVKLHGSLYHAVEENDAYAEVYLERLRSVVYGFGVFSRAGGSFQAKARDVGLKVWEEAFADRGYRSDGSLVPRGETGALLDVDEAVARFEKWQRSGLMDTVDGSEIELKADTFCVHSDSPDSETLLARLKDLVSV